MDIITILILFMIIIVIYAALIAIFQLAFRITGLSKSKAFFQTVSLLTAVGFTTSESETITSHPTRRRLAISLMIIGSFLSIVVISLLVDAVSSFDTVAILHNWVLLVTAFIIFITIFVVFALPFVKRPLEKLIEKIGYSVYAKKYGGNVITILDSYGDDSIVEIVLKKVPTLLEGKTLFKSGLKDQYGINVMFIRRRNMNIQLNKDTVFQEGDIIAVFGNKKSIQRIFSRVSLTKEETNELKKNTRNEIFILENYLDKAMVEITIHVIPDSLKNKTIFESDLRKLLEINIMLIKHGEKVLLVDKDTKIRVGDSLIVFGPYRNIKYLFDSQEIQNEETNEEE